jgi:hypothetical protein
MLKDADPLRCFSAPQVKLGLNKMSFLASRKVCKIRLETILIWRAIYQIIVLHIVL